jgi:hypothetical protein
VAFQDRRSVRPVELEERGTTIWAVKFIDSVTLTDLTTTVEFNDRAIRPVEFNDRASTTPVEFSKRASARPVVLARRASICAVLFAQADPFVQGRPATDAARSDRITMGSEYMAGRIVLLRETNVVYKD